jgi:hypothetical protein
MDKFRPLYPSKYKLLNKITNSKNPHFTEKANFVSSGLQTSIFLFLVDVAGFYAHRNGLRVA